MSRQQQIISWIKEQLSEAPGQTMERKRIWWKFRVSDICTEKDNSASVSVALKTLASRGEVEILVDDNKKVRLR